jgi:hypothetical protein
MLTGSAGMIGKSSVRGKCVMPNCSVGMPRYQCSRSARPSQPNGPLINYKNAHEGDISISLPLKILAVFSIFFGYISRDLFIRLGSGFFVDNSLLIL